MKKTRFTEEQMVKMLREADRTSVSEVAKKHGVSDQTLYNWRRHFGGLDPSDVKRLRQLEQENNRLKKLVVERDLEIEVMKEIAAKKNGERAGKAPASGLRNPAWPIGAPGMHAALGRTLSFALPIKADRARRTDPLGHEGVVGAVPPVRLPSDPGVS